MYMFHSGTIWVYLWISLLSSLVNLSLGLFVIITPNYEISTSLKGLSLNCVLMVNTPSS